MKHKIPDGTKVSFDGDPYVYVIEYQALLSCEKDCKEDHDCFPEPHVVVHSKTVTSKPLSKLKYIFDERGFGRKCTEKDVEIEGR